ncbi:MAG: Threonine--tRNA ligase 2 [Chlamydiales bacterium]|nr:Threonine--tRNA ligase 2 [Chlamydiales bacterium]MCH9619608.1 Threonine--tRNA ligase 2 [Chlamydiales bacterium]MCH9623214.1 Threonine--tRNA ligase 2 [Chlamydiales bacterium]
MIVTVKGKKIELEEKSTGFDLALKLNLTTPDQALAASINGETVDLSSPLKEGDEVQLWSFADAEGKEVYWHSSAHVLAQAVLRLWPDAIPTIGPPIEMGFYYDFANLHISDEDFGKIEKEMEKVVKENHKTMREVLPNKASALEAFETNPYKVELIQGFEDVELTTYRQGEFFDLCRGPHIPNLGKIKALKVLKTSGAYWKGDSGREMLTRIYAVTFPDRKMLKEYLFQIEEAKKRDHKVLGPKLDLFSHREEAPGMAFIHPKGMLMWHALLEFWHERHAEAGYSEIQTPQMMVRDLWERSGHWENYRQNMYTTSIEEREFAIKPMNCPGCMLYYKSQAHSYREFPLRIAEIGHVHRHEASGALSGLMRVRSFHQDDAHIFMEPDQIEDEILKVLVLTDEIYSVFGLDYHLELSTKPEKETIGSDEQWEHATKSLKNALDRSEKPYVVSEGEGAFYGPKIDLHIKDALGRTWQCGTIQLDMALPERFDLEYVGKSGERLRPIMIHRALYGSIERFFAILIEHFAGKFPLWLSPRQVRIIPVADRHVDYAYQIAEKLSDFHCEVDDSHESVSKKIRLAQLNQVNYMLTIGDKEVESQTISLRSRDNVVHGEMQLADFHTKIQEEKRSRRWQD